MEESQKVVLYNLVVRTRRITKLIEDLKDHREKLMEQIIKLQAGKENSSLLEFDQSFHA